MVCQIYHLIHAPADLQLRSYLYAAVLLHCQSSGIMQLVIALVFDLALNRVCDS